MAVLFQLPFIFGLIIQGSLSSNIFGRFPFPRSNENPCNGHKSGDLVQNLLDCHYYWKCGNSGSATLEKCPTGFAFIDGNCVESTASCSISSNACQGLEDNSYIPSLTNCQDLWYCSTDGIKSMSCPDNTTFNPNLNFCTEDYPCGNDVCVGQDINTLVAIENDCTNYWQCSINGPVLKSCGEPLSFNPTDLECQPSTSFECPPYVKFEPNCSTDGSMVPGEYCDQFYVCDKTGPILFVCHDDLVFNPQKQYCVLDNTYTCSVPKNPCKGQDEQARLPIEGNCKNYLMCLENGPVRLTCPKGYEFSTKQGSCVPAENAGCSIVPTNTPTAPLPTESVPTESTIITNTPTTPVPTESTILTPSTEKQVDLQQLCDENKKDIFIPYPNDCTKFIACMANGIAVANTCPNGDHFSSITKLCESPETAQCDPGYSTVTPSTTHKTPPTEGSPNSTPKTPPTEGHTDISTLETEGHSDSTAEITPTEENPDTTPKTPQTDISTLETEGHSDSTAEITPTEENPDTTPKTPQTDISTLETEGHSDSTAEITPTEEHPDSTPNTPQTDISTLETEGHSDSTTEMTPTEEHPDSTPNTPQTDGNTDMSTLNTESTAQTTETTPSQQFLKEACNGKELDSTIDYPGDCQRYITCSEVPTWDQCSQNQYFSSKNSNCGVFENSQCAIENIACADDKQIGAVPGACNKYIICSIKQVIVCNNGQIFDGKDGCTNGSCSQ